MPKRTINVGSPPGDLGDGDLLRDAFVKTNANFDELYAVHPVVDITLNHDDPTIEGTIAKALLDAGAAGGGLVLVGPGVFNCQNKTLQVPGNVILKGVGRGATTIKVTGVQNGITLDTRFSAIESLRVRMPKVTSGDAIKITAGYTHLRDLFVTGVGINSWGVNADRVNICSIENVTFGDLTPSSGGEAFTGNGIIFQNTDQAGFPINYGDSRLAKIDITLAENFTTGIKFSGPDNANVINNILLSQVEVKGISKFDGTVGVHLRNAQRITLQHVDLEQLGIAIIEESSNTSGSANNVYISTFVFNVNQSYVSSDAQRRLFLGCDNLTPENLSEGDVMLPKALWLNETRTRISGIGSGITEIDDGNDASGIQFVLSDPLNPIIRQSGISDTTLLTLGRSGSQGVECKPGMVFPPLYGEPQNPKDGMVAQFAAGVVGTQRGLYQLRDSNWVFIG